MRVLKNLKPSPRGKKETDDEEKSPVKPKAKPEEIKKQKTPQRPEADDQIPETGARELVQQSQAHMQKRPPGSTAIGGFPTKSNLKSKYEDPSMFMPASGIKRNVPGKTNLASLLTKSESNRRPSKEVE